MKLDLRMSSKVSFKSCSWKLLWITSKTIRLRDKFVVLSWNEVRDKTGYVTADPWGRIHSINDLKFTNNGFVTHAIRIDYDLNLIIRNITHMIYVRGCRVIELLCTSWYYWKLQTPSLLGKQKMNNYVGVISCIRS